MPMSVGRASLFLIATLTASRILGWLRLSVIGARFGETDVDAFLAAFRYDAGGVRAMGQRDRQRCFSHCVHRGGAKRNL